MSRFVLDCSITMCWCFEDESLSLAATKADVIVLGKTAS
jgi:hypothetical protein